jgi:glycerophosphoryl diester phosphodiesterase
MKIIAHRGAKLDYPENTISAFKRALEVGVDAIEMDVLASKDGYLIARHDDLIQTDGRWQYVSDLKLEELQRINLGNGERIPALSQVFSQFQGRCQIILDLKSFGLAKLVASFLKNLKSVDGIHVTSFLHREIADMARFLPEADRSITLACIPISYRQLFYDTNTEQVSLFRGYLNEQIVKELHAGGIRVRAYTVNMLEEAKKFSEWGLEGIFTDDPLLMRKLNSA